MRTWSLILATLVTGCLAPPLPQTTSDVHSVRADGPLPPLPLGTNDILQVIVPQRPEFGSEAGYRVSLAGSIVMPIVGAVHVAGLSVEEAKAAIETALVEYVRNPAVGLTVVEYGARRVYVLGEVGRSGAIVLDRNMTALEVLALAEGLRDGARRDRVALLRRHGPDEVEVYFLDADTPGPTAMVQVRPDDVLFVPRSGAGVFRDEALPLLQGIGFTTGQVAAVAVAASGL